MKKSLMLILAFLVVGALAFAAEPTTELKVTTFTGDASVTLGFDIDQGAASFTNAANGELVIEIDDGGDKVSTGDNIWGELKIKSDGDPIRIKADETGFLGLSGYKVIVDVAKLHIGDIAYVGIKKDSTQLNYVMNPDEAAGFFLVDTSKWYGKLADPLTQMVADTSTSVTGVNAQYGLVLGITPKGIGNFTVDFRSVPEWNADGAYELNEWGLRFKADITAVTNLTLQAGVAYSFGPGELDTENTDLGFGGEISYKLSIGDPMFVKPLVAVDALYSLAAGADAVLGYSAQAGVLLGWGDKSKFNMYFSPDKDYDYGYYPGVTVGVILTDTDAATDPSPDVNLNASVFTGALIPNLTANVAFEMFDILEETTAATGSAMGFNANIKYDLKMDPMTITPKFGVYYLSLTPTALTDEQATDIYVKAGLDIAKIFPNCTLSFLYQSNDFNGGVANGASTEGDDVIGMFATTFKIAF